MFYGNPVPGVFDKVSILQKSAATKRMAAINVCLGGNTCGTSCGLALKQGCQNLLQLYWTIIAREI